MNKLSIIVPCYNEEESIPFFFEEMEKIQKIIDYQMEYIFIDDGSSDNTLNVIKELHSNNIERVFYLSFSRNFGKEAAIYAGLKQASGQLVTTMDVDLQDPPGLLIEMIDSIENEGFDCVATSRADRKGEPRIRSIFAQLFYWLINKMSDTPMVNGARDFRMMTRQMTDAILELSEYNRFSKGLFSWVGFKTKYLTFENVERQHGSTSWNFFSLFKYSIEGIINFSDFPLKLATFFGLFTFFLSFFLMIFFFLRTLFIGNPTSGWTSVTVIILFLGSIQLLGIGVIGEYIARIFLETKKRPLFIIQEKSEKC